MLHTLVPPFMFHSRRRAASGQPLAGRPSPLHAPLTPVSSLTAHPELGDAATCDAISVTLCTISSALRAAADATYTSFFVVWATGYAIDLVPELPTLVTYGSDSLPPAAVGDAQSYVWISTSKCAQTCMLSVAYTLYALVGAVGNGHWSVHSAGPIMGFCWRRAVEFKHCWISMAAPYWSLKRSHISGRR